MEDKDVTRRLRQAGVLLGNRILDHLIFGEEGFLSMLEGNLFYEGCSRCNPCVAIKPPLIKWGLHLVFLLGL